MNLNVPAGTVVEQNGTQVTFTFMEEKDAGRFMEWFAELHARTTRGQSVELLARGTQETKH